MGILTKYMIKVAAKINAKYGGSDIDYYKLGFEDGEITFKDFGFYSDILSAASSFLEPYTLDPNSDDYEKKLMQFAKGVIDGSKMKHGKGYGSIEGELGVLQKHLNWVNQQKEKGIKLEKGYHHP